MPQALSDLSAEEIGAFVAAKAGYGVAVDGNALVLSSATGEELSRCALPTGTALEAYPVGSIYLSVNATDPATLFGGTWQRIQDMFLLAAGSTYAAGTTGGQTTVSLTTANLPAHTHGSKTLTGGFRARHYGTGTDTGAQLVFTPSGIVDINANTGTIGKVNIGGAGNTGGYEQVTVNATHEHESVGGGTAHDNMPPYLAVYVWQRVS